MAGKLNLEDKAKMVELAELLATQSGPIKAWAKNSGNGLLSGMAYGIFLSMHGVAQGLIDMIEDSK